MPTSQDLVKRIDLTGLTTITGSEMNQLLETALPAEDKGLNIVTTDSAVGVPIVPNPDTELEGVTPSHWTRYTWIRRPHADAGATSLVEEYVWNPNLAEHATYLKWENINARAIEALELAESAAEDAEAAVTASTAATATAATAATTATAASTLATETAATVEDLEADVEDHEQTIEAHETRLDALEEGQTEVNEIANGGTGATTVNGAVANLGLYKSAVAHVFLKDLKNVGIDGGTFTSGDWQTRNLNTSVIIGMPSGITLNGDSTFTLAAGSYIVEAEAPAFGVEEHQAVLYNESTAAIHTVGTSEYSQISGGPVSTKSKVLASVNVVAATIFSIKHQCTTTVATNGLGQASGFTDELYTLVKITRLQS